MVPFWDSARKERCSVTALVRQDIPEVGQSNAIEHNRTIEFDCRTQSHKIELTQKKFANRTQLNV